MRYRHKPPLSPVSDLPDFRRSSAASARLRKYASMRCRTARSNFLSCCAAELWNSTVQAKFALQFFQRNPRLLAFERGNTEQVVLAVLQILVNGEPGVVALAAPSLLGQFLQPLFQFGFQTNAQHNISSAFRC